MPRTGRALGPFCVSAKVAELADALDLGSSGPKPCGFESHLSHHPSSFISHPFERAMTVLNYEELSPVQKTIEVEIPAALLSREADRVTNEFGRQAQVPGFRPGKIPASVVRTRFAKEIQEEVVTRVLGQTFRDAMKEKGLDPVGEPRLEHIDPF